MDRNLLMFGVNFVVLLLLQIFVCNAMYFGIYLNIQIYLMFILFFPVKFSNLLTLLLSALLGFCVDLLSGELGLHTAACVAIGYVRPYLLRSLSKSDQIDIPPINKTHFRQYIIYVVILVFLHHFVLFTLETFELEETLFILTRTVVSATVNIILITFIRQLKIGN